MNNDTTKNNAAQNNGARNDAANWLSELRANPMTKNAVLIAYFFAATWALIFSGNLYLMVAAILAPAVYWVAAYLTGGKTRL